ncbi:MAG TPA: carbohydrate kinase, partial [Bacillales bacterium]|nr:carbohydrate kinase [Bacillales bacterium]
MKKGVICLGEALIDWIPIDERNLVYEKCPGGAPANVAVGLAKLGVESSFVGKVGKDLLGKFLRDTLKNGRVNVSSMMLSDEAKTGITFVTLDKSGERDFEFYIERSADQLLRENEIDETLFEKYSLLHVGSISLIREPARSATIKAVKAAKASGLRVSFDPNVRMGLWPSEARAKEAIIGLLPEVDILKVSSEELSFITGQSGMEEGIEALAPYKIPLIFVTLGAEGSRVFHSKTNV